MSDESTPDRPDEPVVGTWTYDVSADHWTWSAEVFTCLGFSPGEVVPSTGLLAAHLDGPQAAGRNPADPHGGLVDLLRSGDPFARHLQIRDARDRPRSLIAVGRGSSDADGGVREVRGYLVDLTTWRRDASAADIRSGIAAAAVSRAEIDQAKGALMALHGFTADEAFASLVRQSQHDNVKVRDLAARLVETLREAGSPLDGQRTGDLDGDDDPGDLPEQATGT